MKDFIEPVKLPEDLKNFLEYDPNDSDEKLLRRTVARKANKHKLSREAANQVYAQLKKANFVLARLLMYSFWFEIEQWEKKYSEETRERFYQLALRTIYYLMGRNKLEKLFRKIALGLPSQLEAFAKMGEKLEANGVKLPAFDELPTFRQEPIKMTMAEVTWLFFRRIDLSKRPSEPISEEEQAKYAKLAVTMMG